MGKKKSQAKESKEFAIYVFDSKTDQANGDLLIKSHVEASDLVVQVHQDDPLTEHAIKHTVKEICLKNHLMSCAFVHLYPEEKTMSFYLQKNGQKDDPQPSAKKRGKFPK